MPESHKGECSICGNEDELCFLGLSVKGSRGIWICGWCRLALVHVAESIQSIAERARRTVELKHLIEKKATGT